ncbi:MAG: polysaccharide biosynthesis protein [Eubacterium sp.]|nr:polysaccharide biosynthesis protein [Eubacterium sp.]
MQKRMKENTFIQGAMVSSALFIIIKILGALYVIPFYKIIGEHGGTLYSYAYNIYNLFLNISTAGIPIAMSMIISEYLALEMFDAKQRAKKVATKAIAVLAVVSFLIVFFGSELFARFLLSDATGGHSVSEVSNVIKMTSLCLLIIPFLSVLRGYLQGYKFITVTSFSQVIEQIVRIIVVLAGSFVAIKILDSSIEVGVCVALSGAFFGGLIAYLYLKLKMKNQGLEFEKIDKKDDISDSRILKKIIGYCIPIIMIAVIDNIYNLVDIRLIVKGLNLIGYEAMESQTISGIVATWAPKICSIIIAISLSLTTNIIPHITTSYIKNDHDGVNHRINQAISTMIMITVPMVTLLFLLSKESYSIFYGESKYGTLILAFSAISHMLLGISSVFNSILQSMKKFKMIYINTITGLLCNTLLDIPVIILLDKQGLPPYIGTIIATCIGYIVSITIVVFYLKKEMGFHFRDTLKLIRKMLLPTVTTVLLLVGLKYLIVLGDGRLMSFIGLALFGGVGALVFLFIAYKNGAINTVFGDKFAGSLIKKLKRK